MPRSRIDCVTGQMYSAVTSFHGNRNMAGFRKLTHCIRRSCQNAPAPRSPKGSSERICLGTSAPSIQCIDGREKEHLRFLCIMGLPQGAKWLEPPLGA